MIIRMFIDDTTKKNEIKGDEAEKGEVEEEGEVVDDGDGEGIHDNSRT